MVARLLARSLARSVDRNSRGRKQSRCCLAFKIRYSIGVVSVDSGLTVYVESDESSMNLIRLKKKDWTCSFDLYFIYKKDWICSFDLYFCFDSSL